MKNMQTKSHLSQVKSVTSRNGSYTSTFDFLQTMTMTMSVWENIYMFIAVKLETTGSFDRNLKIKLFPFPTKVSTS